VSWGNGGPHSGSWWFHGKDEVTRNPMARIRAPIVPEQPVPVVGEDGLRRLLAACAGKDFDARRDLAMVMLLADAGPRVSELVGMRVVDVDFDLEVVGVLGKGRRERALPFGRRTAVALDRYLRVRERHRDADATWLWLGQRGQLTRWASGRCWSATLCRPASRTCTRTSCATPSATSGWRRVAAKRT
jgi:site-specific recombinase XerC